MKKGIILFVEFIFFISLLLLSLSDYYTTQKVWGPLFWAIIAGVAFVGSCIDLLDRKEDNNK